MTGLGAVGDGRLGWTLVAGLGVVVAAAFGTGHPPSIVELVVVLAVLIPLGAVLGLMWLRWRRTVRNPVDHVTAPPTADG